MVYIAGSNVTHTSVKTLKLEYAVESNLLGFVTCNDVKRTMQKKILTIKSMLIRVLIRVFEQQPKKKKRKPTFFHF